MAEWAPAVGDVLATIERRDWARLRRMLDLQVHWTTSVEEEPVEEEREELVRVEGIDKRAEAAAGDRPELTGFQA